MQEEAEMKILGEKGRANVCGVRIRKIRQERGYSQNDLAIKLQLADMNLTQKAISRIETGDRVVPDYELKYFTAVLDVSVTELLGVGVDCIIKIGMDSSLFLIICYYILVLQAG